MDDPTADSSSSSGPTPEPDPSREPTADRIARHAAGLEASTRETYISGACGKDESLRNRVHQILDDTHDPQSSSSSEDLTSAEPPSAEDLGILDAGQRVASYTIQSHLGHGGMGVVYRAQQDKPKREVALKLMRPGMVTRRSMRRFEYEAEILGRLRHPGIAQIHEAGLHDGTPFFAMEFVDGIPLDRYAKEQQLDTRARLELFTLICRAVNHAHTQGVIHRDLKPANVLVVNMPSAPHHRPKILDFGIARATDADLRTATIETQAGQILGTVPYMSPEQIGGDPTAVDLRTDVYALGVLLFQLLTGRMPYDVSGRMLADAARVIQEQDPTRLSTLDTRLKGDIETIVGKALEKDAERRYQTAAELADDVERHLRDEPILARPPSTVYLARKFTKRHKALVGGVATAFVALIAGLAASLYYLNEAVDARNAEAEARGQAETAQQEAEDNLELANRRLGELEQIVDFQESVWEGVVPSDFGEELATKIRALDGVELTVDPDKQNPFYADITMAVIDDLLLGRAAESIGNFTDTPESEIRIRESLAGVYFGFGKYDRVRPHYERALELRLQIDGELHEDTLTLLHNMGYMHTNANEFEQSLQYFRRASEGRANLFGPDHERTMATTGAYGTVLQLTGRYAEAVPIYLRVLEFSQKSLGDDHPQTVRAHNNLGGLYRQLDKPDIAEPHYRKAYETALRLLGPEANPTLTYANNLASVWGEELQRYDEAETMHRTVLETRERLYGSKNSDTLVSMNNFGTLYQVQGRHDEALELLRPAYDGLLESRGPNNNTTLAVRMKLAESLGATGETEQAIDHLQSIIDARNSLLGEDHSDTLDAQIVLAQVLIESDQPAAALAVAEPNYLRACSLDPRFPDIEEGLLTALITAAEMLEGTPDAPSEADVAAWRAALEELNPEPEPEPGSDSEPETDSHT